MVSSGIPTTRSWDDPHDRAFLGRHKIVGQYAIGFRMLGGHEFSELDLKGRLRPLMNKVPFLLHFECFLVNFNIFFIFLWARPWWEHDDFFSLKMCITVDVVDLVSSKIVLG